ncbi:hypothetical protein [Echinicola rosea]|uniref:hypothetical protein n=1 Tax=Echinicola rosea TaxID=1807691 RepID=UPI0010CA6B33|nr:hypothetical protein [Echinicola rosea]
MQANLLHSAFQKEATIWIKQYFWGALLQGGITNAFLSSSHFKCGTGDSRDGLYDPNQLIILSAHSAIRQDRLLRFPMSKSGQSASGTDDSSFTRNKY